MADTLFSGPAVSPFAAHFDGVDNVFLCDPPLLEELAEAMTAGRAAADPPAHFDISEQMMGVNLGYGQSHPPLAPRSSPPSHYASSASASEAASRSPGRAAAVQPLFPSLSESDLATFDFSSTSPSTSALVLTPSSTNQDYSASFHGDTDDFDAAAATAVPAAISPSTDSNVSPATDSDFVHVPSRGNRHPAAARYAASTSTTFMTPPALTHGASRASLESSGAVSSAPTSATASLPTVSWAPSSATDERQACMAHSQASTSSDLLGHPFAYDDSPFTHAGQQFNDVGLSDFSASPFDGFAISAGFAPDTNLSTRAMHIDGRLASQELWRIGPHLTPPSMMRPQAPSDHYAAAAGQQEMELYALQQAQSRISPAVAGHFHPLDIPSATTAPITQQQHQQEGILTAPAGLEHQFFATFPTVTNHTPRDPVRRSVPNLPSSQYHQAPPVQQRHARQTLQPFPSNVSETTLAGPSSQPLPPIAKRHTGEAPRNAPSRASPAERARRGGRQKHSHLEAEARQKSNKMRKVAACWRCALQRDPCDEGSPCKRCSIRSQKGQTYFFDCDRSKLPDFVHDFLPPSMTLVNQRQSIEDCVNEQVHRWDHGRPFDILLTSGYGPALQWRVYEFEPRTKELLTQLQYLQDPQTQQERRNAKYAPPLGLLKLDASDDTRLENYLDELMLPNHLSDFGWTFYEEESQTDPEHFQAGTLALICTLYGETKDQDLREVLHQVIRMLIITYIMGHTLTLQEDTLPEVLSRIRSPHPDVAVRHTSPRLANRQLKFFFSVFRSTIYSRILKWQQQTLHTSGKKEGTWLQAFVAMLGFAMVLEEVQRTLHIQADAKVVKGLMSREMANTEARNACERIDARFKLLIGLFQCKYRDRKWGTNGSFGSGTPVEREPSAKEFLRELREMVEMRRDHLRNRRDVEFTDHSECLYTSRLVARFLLPFLDLPAG